MVFFLVIQEKSLHCTANISSQSAIKVQIASTDNGLQFPASNNKLRKKAAKNI